MLRMAVLPALLCAAVIAEAAAAQGVNPSNGAVGGAITGYGTVLGATPADTRPFPGAPAPELDTPGYVLTAGEADRYEIEAAMIARDRAQSMAVRIFADEMMRDHM